MLLRLQLFSRMNIVYIFPCMNEKNCRQHYTCIPHYMPNNIRLTKLRSAKQIAVCNPFSIQKAINCPTYMCQGHLHCPTTRYEASVHHDVTGHVHGVLKVTFNLVEHVLTGPPQQDGAGLRVLTVHQEGEVPGRT